MENLPQSNPLSRGAALEQHDFCDASSLRQFPYQCTCATPDARHLSLLPVHTVIQNAALNIGPACNQHRDVCRRTRRPRQRFGLGLRPG